MVAVRLGEARFKVERARKHLADLNAALGPRVDTERNRVVVDYDPDEGCFIASRRLDFVRAPPPDVALILGDAIHNLRGALDFTTWQLALVNKAPTEPTEKEAPQIQFPICDKPGGFAGSKVLGHIRQTAAKELALHQPYAPPLGGAHDPPLLALLRDLSNRDKHRLLLPRGFSGGDPLRYDFDPPVESFRVEDGWATNPSVFPGNYAFRLERIFITPENRDTKIEVNPQPPILPKVGAIMEDVDMAKLEALADCVEFVIGRFARHV